MDVDGEKFVTLWLANFASADLLVEYIEIKYTEDGDSIPSNFEKDFKLGHYDCDLIESDWIAEESRDIEQLLRGFSYDEQIIGQFKRIESNYNAIILIYDYSYEKEEQKSAQIVKRAYKVDVIGTANYRTADY